MKVLALTLLSSLLLAAQTVETAEEKNVTIIDGSIFNATTVISGKPIVIHTQLQHYDQPTLREYQECHENLQKCKTVCEGVENPNACAKQCPVCPLLIKEQIVVQGVNDSVVTPVLPTPLNTTNIIRLTNQIQNIIESHQGNITYGNENIVQIHQNISRVGGKFGLGYNNTDPCCIIVRSATECETKRFSTAKRCHNKRHRVCGKQCKSRVMLAKRLTVCEKPLSFDDFEEYSEEKCQETVKYFPYRQSRRRSIRSVNKCRYTPSWPYIKCHRNAAHYDYAICSRCHGLTYSYILRKGMPAQCRGCFMSYSSSSYDIMPPRYPFVRPPPINDYNDFDFDFEDNFDFELGGWKEDKIKCRLPDGTISENCQEIEGSGSESLTITENPFKNLPQAQDEYEEYNYFDEQQNDADFEQNSRRRRHVFKRSKYSQRYKQ